MKAAALIALLLMVGCTTMPHHRCNEPLDPLAVASHLTKAVHCHMQHGRVPHETWDVAEALQRQRGLCSQQAMALHGLFRTFGIESRVLGLDGHVICLALVGDAWITCDPDYGVVVPIDITKIEQDPSLVTPYYGKDMPAFNKEGNHYYTSTGGEKP